MKELFFFFSARVLSLRSEEENVFNPETAEAFPVLQTFPLAACLFDRRKRCSRKDGHKWKLQRCFSFFKESDKCWFSSDGRLQLSCQY